MHWLDDVDELLEDTEAAPAGQPLQHPGLRALLVRANEAVSKELMLTLMEQEVAGACDEEDEAAPDPGADAAEMGELEPDGDVPPVLPSSADVAAAAESLCAETVAAAMRAHRYSVQNTDARTGPAFQRAQDLGRQKALLSVSTLTARGVDFDVRITPSPYIVSVSLHVLNTHTLSPHYILTCVL
jgi:hypothetical protein